MKMKNKNIFIFIPNTLEKSKTGNIEGVFKQYDDCDAYYITSDKIIPNSSYCIGFAGKYEISKKTTSRHLLHLDLATSKFNLLDKDTCGCSVVYIIYDFKAFMKSDVIHSSGSKYGKHFKCLSNCLRLNNNITTTNGRKSIFVRLLTFITMVMELLLKKLYIGTIITKNSSTILHFHTTLKNLKWLLDSLKIESKISPKIGNAVVSKVVDLIIGFILLRCLVKYEDQVLVVLQETAETIILKLRELLIYLMGVPIGLKLNFAFNKSLGTFFFYHISLWKVFLQVLFPLLKEYVHLLMLPATLGFSFQIAMLSDIIYLSTFHVYCIYIYAARIFQLQVEGIASLWRVLIGRKYNPLRQRVDSCEYSPDQLFIGTLGFTVLLFLLPTTLMYYAVFTTFRLLIVIIQEVLTKLCYILNNLPLYAILLWLFDSSNIAGTLNLEWIDANEESCLILEAKLHTLSLFSCMEKFIPHSAQEFKKDSFRGLLQNIVTGCKM